MQVLNPFRLSLRLLLPLLLLAGALLEMGLSMAQYLNTVEQQTWAHARQRGQRELALLTVASERTGAADESLLAELLAQATSDPQLAWAAVLDPQQRVVVATASEQRGQALSAFPWTDPTWSAGLVAGGEARFIEDPAQSRLVLVQAFAWPADESHLRGERAGMVMLRYELGPTLASEQHTSLRHHLVQLALPLAAALLLYGVLRHYVAKPLVQLTQAATRLGQGGLGTRIAPAALKELNLLGEAFNQMASELSATLQAQADSEQQLRDLIATAPDAILTVAVDGHIESFNRAAEALFGYNGSEIIGSPLRRLLPERVAGMHDAWVSSFGQESDASTARRMAGGRQVQAQHRNGSLMAVEISISVSQAAGERRFTAVLRDIRARQAMDAELARHRLHLEDLVAERTEELARSRDEAQAATRAKSEFLANMSHEIRTPMNAILGLAYLARRDAAPAQLALLDKLQGAARHLLGILNDVLDFSKIEAGKLQLSERDFDVDDLVDQACQMVCDRAVAKQLEVVQRIDPTLPTHLRGDDLRLGQVLVNLIGNAVKFTDRGHVRVNVARVAGPQGEPAVRFEVRDTGIGMDASQLSRIFSAFEQADSSTTRRFGGTGLGLTISRRLVALMGGTLRVDSREGQGSRFWFELPLRQALSPVPGRRAMTRFEGTRALVVDDLADAREVLLEMLEMLGLRVQEASSGEEALRLLAKAEADGDAFELCVLDWHMPGMDGVQTARQIRALPLALQPAFLMISAMGGQVPVPAMAEVGFSGILVKPVSPSQLHDALTRALRPEQGRMAGPALTSRWQPDPRSQVLVVEDNPLNREVSAQLLEGMGLSPDLACDGIEAVEMARLRHYDLILMDVQMPRMDGLEATLEIRKLPGHEHTPIVAMTANAFMEDRERCRAAGMDDFVSKPVDLNELDAALRRWIAPAATPRLLLPARAAQSPQPAWTQVPGLDLSATLHSLKDSPALLRRLLGVFAEHHAHTGAQLLQALAQGRLDQMNGLLHQLRGAVGTLGGQALVMQIHALETELTRGVPPTHDAVATLAQDLDTVVQALRATLAAPVPGEAPAEPLAGPFPVSDPPLDGSNDPSGANPASPR